MKKYWKSILVSICLVFAVFVGLKGLKIERPNENIEAESIVDSNITTPSQEEEKNEANETPKVEEESSEGESSKAQPATKGDSESKGESNKKNNGDTVDNGTNKDTGNDVVIDTKKYVTLSIRNDTILNNMDKFTGDPKYLNNGAILSSTKVELTENDKTVFDVLYRITRGKRIPIDYGGSKENAYIKGINNIYEFDCGDGSGWMYKVNGVFPNYGVGRYNLKGGENIEFIYTCDLGNDIGGGIK